MPVRSILEIDVDDSAFRNFQTLFQKYQTALNQMPGTWAKVNQGTAATQTSFTAMAAALMAQAQMLHTLTTRTQAFGHAANTTAASFSRMNNTLHSMGGQIKAITLDLLKWTTITEALGGLIGAGGLWGISRLAQNAAGMRRNAMGMGTQPFSQQAFGLSFGRLVDPSQFLGGTQEALSDVTKRWTLYGAGLNERQMRGDPTQVATQLLPAIRRIVQQTDPSQLAQVMQARGLNQFIGLQDAQRLRGMSEEEFQSLLKQKVELEKEQHRVTVDQLRTWTELNNRLQIAGQRIENAFIVGLGRLSPELIKLSDAFSKAVSSFLQSDAFKHWIDLAAKGLENLDKWISGPSFQKDVQDFVKGVGDLALAIGNALHWITGVVGAGGPPAGSGIPPNAQRVIPGLPLPPGLKTVPDHPGWAVPEGEKTTSDPRGQIGNLRASAIRHGWNPDDVLRVANAEGLHEAKYATWDVNNWSFGALQAHVGGMADEFKKATGMDPSKPENEAALNDWLLDWASKNNWKKWTSVTSGRVPTPRRLDKTAWETVTDKAEETKRWFTHAHHETNGFLVPPGTEFSKTGPNAGKPFSAGLAKMTPKEKANEEASYRAIREAQQHGRDPYAVQPATRIEIHNQTGGSAVVTGSQIAQ